MILVGSSGPLTARLACIGEGPGREEEQQGVPLVGQSGQHLNAGLGGDSVRQLVYCNNARPYRKPEGEKPAARHAAVAEWSARHLSLELPKLTEARTILAIGADALWYFTGIDSIFKYHGSVLSREEVEALHGAMGGPSRPPLPPNVHSLVACVHPAAAMRAGQWDFLDEIKAVIRRAWNWANKPSLPPRAGQFELVLNATPEAVELALRDAPSIVFDLETQRQDFREITVAAVSGRSGRVLAFKWSERHAATLRPFLESPRVAKIGHNFTTFDTRSLALTAEANRIHLDGPTFDTINAGSLLWVPVPQKKQAEEAGRKRLVQKRLALAPCALRCFADVAYWKEPDSRVTQVIMQTSWPEVRNWEWEQLYCAQDVFQTGRLSVAEGIMLQQARLHDYYTRYEAPAQLPLARMDVRGMAVDFDPTSPTGIVALHDLEQAKLERVRREIRKEVKEIHEARRGEVKKEVERLQGERADLFGGNAQGCATHEDYRGETRRRKDECCRQVWEAATPRREQAAGLRDRIARGRTILAQIGEEFDIGKDDHWRFLLFDADGLNAARPKAEWIKPPFRTGKTKKASVKLEAMEVLLKEYPDVPLIRHRVEAQHAFQAIRGVLNKRKMKADADGRTRFVRSMCKTATGRTTGGKDDQEVDKVRKAPININSVKKEHRSIFIAFPDDWLLLDADWSQIELRLVAWHAREMEMLRLLAEGGDIHAENAVLIGRALGMATPADRADFKSWSKATPFPSGVEDYTMRDAGKTCSHGWNFGLDRTNVSDGRGAKKTAKYFGLTLDTATAARGAYFERWKAIDKFQEQTIWLARTNRTLRTSFGRRSGRFGLTKRKGNWALADVEEALAFLPQSEPSTMIKVAWTQLDGFYRSGKVRAGLLTTTYDELLTEVHKDDLLAAATEKRRIMEQKWPELGNIEGFGEFWCPVEMSVGRNWGEYHRHDETCRAKECGKVENLNGLREMEVGA